MSIELSSDAFRPGERIPLKYTREGANVSPPLKWSKLPSDTRELAIIVEDPDAPTSEPFVHWVAYKINPDAGGLPEGIPKKTPPKTAAIGAQGENSFHDLGYDGPQPPPGHGTHHYHFEIYALDQPLEVKGKLDHKALLASMTGHILDRGELVGTYER